MDIGLRGKKASVAVGGGGIGKVIAKALSDGGR